MNTTTTKAATQGIRWIAGVAILGLVVQTGWLSIPALAQQPVNPEAAGCLPPNTLPVVPAYPPRPLTGTMQGEMWPGARQGKDAAPVATLVDPLRGNDAAIKLRIGEGRLLTFKTDIAGARSLIALGDPTIADFVPIDNRRIRLVGRRAGSTDLSVIGADGQAYGFELQVLYDLDMVSAHLRQAFPNDTVRLSQMRSVVVVEGEVRSIGEVGKILQMVYQDLQSISFGAAQLGAGGQPLPTSETPPVPPAPGPSSNGPGNPSQTSNNNAHVLENVTVGSPESLSAVSAGPRVPIVNLLRVPGVNQVNLQVRVAELNRTALRRVGADLLYKSPSGNLIGTNIAGSGVTAAGLLGLPVSGNIGNTTAFGIFPTSNFEILLNVLRENSLLSIMAEPNLVAMSGMQASFLAGGQFPVPVPQGGTGVTSVVTVQWQSFGVQLNFTPYVLSDDTIRLTVNPVVSSIDQALGTTLVAGGSPVPGLDSRSATTTVEMKEGQTLAIAGLLQVTLDANTSRIPFLGDLPYIGPLFSNTSHQRIEKELLVLVTPHLVAPLDPCQVPCLPGSDIKDPTDLEFYLKNRIEGHVDANYRSTANWDQPLGCKRIINLEKNYVNGPVGFSQ
jgi:pilus assembly protein CpaC